MRAVLQRVTEAAVEVEGQVTGRIALGWVVLLGIAPDDAETDLQWLAGKVVSLRAFERDQGGPERALSDVGGDVLLISQFTLLASTRHGQRPSWHRAAPPALAQPLFQQFHQELERRLGRPVPRGVFGAHMRITAVQDGPVTLILDSRLRE